MSPRRTNAGRVGYTSEVVRGAEHGEEHARRILELDRDLLEQGYDIPKDIVGKNGVELEEIWLMPFSKRVKHVGEEGLPEIPDDERAIRAALQQNPYLNVYDQWKMHARPWLHDLHESVCQELETYCAAHDIRLLPGMAKRLVKPVPCLQTQMDLHRGTDAFFVFHDPAKYEAAARTFNAGSPTDAAYWNPQADTIVTLDITASLSTKRDRAVRRNKTPRADVFASKVGAEANDGLRQYLGGAGHQTLIRNSPERIRQLGKLIFSLYLAKKEHGIPALRNPEQENAERVAQEAQQRREQYQATLAGKQDRKEREAKKEAQRREQSDLSKKRRDTRAAINAALDPTQERKRRTHKRKQ